MKKIFKNLINWIKNLFVSSNKTNKKNDEKTIEYYIPNLDKNMSLSLFNDIRVGDIIYAPSSYSVSRLKNTEESHRQRPYIIVKKENNYLIGFSGTSNLKTKYNSSLYLCKDFYHVSKDGIINLTNLHKIPNIYILSIVDHLLTVDMLKINEVLCLSNGNIKQRLFFDLNVALKPGMVINISYESKNYFFVYKVDEIYVTLYRLQKDPSDIKLMLNKDVFYIDENKQEVIKNDFDYVILKINQLDTLKTINDKFYNAKASSNKSKKVKFEDTYYFKYEIGQVFIAGMRTFVYLFSRWNEHYGIEIYDDESISDLMNIRCNTEYLHEDGMLEKDEILDVVEETAERNSKCKWLYDLVKEKYGIIDDIEEDLIQDDEMEDDGASIT